MYYKLPNDGYFTVRCDRCGKFLYKTEKPTEGRHFCKATSDNEMSCEEKFSQPRSSPPEDVPYPPSWGDTAYLSDPAYNRINVSEGS